MTVIEGVALAFRHEFETSDAKANAAVADASQARSESASALGAANEARSKALEVELVANEAALMAETAVDTAQASKSIAETANTKSSSAVASAASALSVATAAQAAAEAAATAQTSGVIGYATKDELDEDLAHDENAVAWVTNDPNVELNGTYRKVGASGTGSWQQSSYDRVVQVEGELRGFTGRLQADATGAEQVQVPDGAAIRRIGGEWRHYDPVREEPPLLVVSSESERNAVGSAGSGHRAYPPGRRIYDYGLRSELIADGTFWRLPDGTPADAVPRIPKFPTLPEIKAILPTYAQDYALIDDMSSAAGWSFLSGSASTMRHSTDKGFDSLYVEFPSGSTPEFRKDYGAPITAHKYFVFDTFIEHVATGEGLATIQFRAYNANGDLLFTRTLNADDTGSRPAPHPRSGLNHWTVFRDDMSPQQPGASWDDVTQLGFRLTRYAGWTARVWIGRIETVNFRPMVTLRFDDHRASVFAEAFPRMQSYGFAGVTAVICGVADLMNDPRTTSYGSHISKANLLLMRASGWDLVSHTVTNRSLTEIEDFDDLAYEFRASRDYLRDELGAGEVAPYVHVPPRANAGFREHQVGVRYVEAILQGTNRGNAMPRDPVGVWNAGGTWRYIGSYVGDNKTAAQMIAAIEQAIERQEWVFILIHDLGPTAGTSQVAVTEFEELLNWLDANRAAVDVVTITEAVQRMRGEA